MTNIDEKLKNKTALKVVLAALEVCNYLGIFSLVLLCCGVYAVFKIKSMSLFMDISFTMCFFVQLLCVLLQYDKKLFNLLCQCDSTEEFDIALNVLWNKKIQPGKTIEQRCKGTRNLIFLMIFFLACQLLFLIISLKFNF